MSQFQHEKIFCGALISLYIRGSPHQTREDSEPEWRRFLRELGGFFVASMPLVQGGALFGKKCPRLINLFGKDDAECR